MDFNKPWNLVRDQGVGGSNPLAPTIIPKKKRDIAEPYPDNGELANVKGNKSHLFANFYRGPRGRRLDLSAPTGHS